MGRGSRVSLVSSFLTKKHSLPGPGDLGQSPEHSTLSTLILGLCKMCRVGNRERLNFWRKMRVLYISQRLTSFSDAPLYVNSPDRRSENYLTSDLIQRDGRSIQSIAIDISMPMPMQGSKWKCQACKLEVKELENFFGKVIGRRKENNWDYLYTIAACWL